jgi:type IV fimbrial biogenesis protein FimT
LRAVILNNPAHTAITYQASTVPLTGSRGSQHVWGFLPNGTFGYGTSPGLNNLSPASGSVRIFMTDAKADTDEAKQARASTLLIDSGGRVSFCLKKDEKRTACAEPAKEK